MSVEERFVEHRHELEPWSPQRERLLDLERGWLWLSALHLQAAPTEAVPVPEARVVLLEVIGMSARNPEVA